MAITPASFVPEKRGAGGGGGGPGGANGGGPGPSVGHAATVHGGVDMTYNEATDMSQMASHETMPANHPITGTALPMGTGAGKGSIHKGGRGGK